MLTAKDIVFAKKGPTMKQLLIDSFIKQTTEGNSFSLFVGPFLKNENTSNMQDEPQGDNTTINILKTAFCFGLGVIAIAAITVVAIIYLTTR